MLNRFKILKKSSLPVALHKHRSTHPLIYWTFNSMMNCVPDWLCYCVCVRVCARLFATGFKSQCVAAVPCRYEQVIRWTLLSFEMQHREGGCTCQSTRGRPCPGWGGAGLSPRVPGFDIRPGSMGFWCRIHLWFRWMGGSACKVDDVTALPSHIQDCGYALLWQRYDNNKMAAICYSTSSTVQS